MVRSNWRQWFSRKKNAAIQQSTRRSFVPLEKRQKLRLELLEDRTTPSAFVENELLVQYAPGFTGREANRIGFGVALVEEIHTAAMQSSGAGVIERLQLPGTMSVDDAIAHFSTLPGVEYAERNWIYTTSVVSNDPYYTAGGASLWGMYSDDSPSAVGPVGTTNQFGTWAEKAWNDGDIGSNTVYIGIIDEGIQFLHPDLDANVWTNPYDPVDGIDNDGNGRIDDIHGWDFYNNDNSIYDSPSTDAHGTHVSGTIGAEGGNATGVVGMNWSVTMISGKFLQGSGSTANAILALDYLTDLKQRHGLNIIATNNSWGGGGASTPLHAAINRSAKAGILFFAAAGNVNQNNDAVANYPSNYSTLVAAGSESAASYEAVTAVASITSTGARSSFSSYGATTVDIGAPGSSINSTYPSLTYGPLSGTSMATPHVTGAAALYAAKYPGATPQQIRNALLNNATPTTSMSGITVTGGRLNVYAALQDAPGSGPVINDSDLSFSPSPVNEGSGVTLNGSWTDSTAGDSHEITIAWGDGNTDVLNPAVGARTFSKSHTYVDNKPGDAPYNVVVTVKDSTNLSDNANKDIVVRNVVPSVTINNAPASVDEGTPINLASTVTDPGILDTTFSYAWSVTKNGNPYSPGTPTNQATFSFTPNDNGAFRVFLAVTDKDSGVGNATPVNITVNNVPPQNVTIEGAPTGNIDEGTQVDLNAGPFTDPGSADTHTYLWTVTLNGNPYNPGTPTDQATFSFIPNDNGTFVVTLTITDDDGGAGSDNVTINVDNVAPTPVINGAPTDSDEGTQIDLTCTENDPGSADTFTYLWSVTRNGNQYIPGTPVDQADFSFTPNDDGVFQIDLRVTDDDGGATDAIPVIINVHNVNPTATLSNDGPTGVDLPVNIVFSNQFDPGAIDTLIGFRYSLDLNNDGDFTDPFEFADSTQSSAVVEFATMGTYNVRGVIKDKDGGSTEVFTTVVINRSGNSGVVNTRTFAAGMDAGDDPLAKLYNTDGTLRFSLFAYDFDFTGGVRVASGDVDGDGIEDLITAPGSGMAPLVKVFSGADGSLLRSFLAFAPNFTGGVNVATGDVNKDGFSDIIVAAGAGGGPHVRVFTGRKSGIVLKDFYAYDARFNGGVNVASGDVNGDGFFEVITAPGASLPRSFAQNPLVKVFNGNSPMVPTLMRQFLAFESYFTNGVTVAAGDINKDGKADLVLGTMARPNYLSKIRVVDGASVATGTVQRNLWNFVAVPNYRGGVRVAVEDLNGDGYFDILFTQPATGQPGKITAINGKNLVKMQVFAPFDPYFLGGVFVG